MIGMSIINLNKKPRRYKRYIRGPLPLGWFTRVAALSGKACCVGLVIWREAYLKGLFGKPIKVTNKMCREFSVSPDQKNRVLKMMHEANLLRLECRRGASPMVRIIDFENLTDREEKD